MRTGTNRESVTEAVNPTYVKLKGLARVAGGDYMNSLPRTYGYHEYEIPDVVLDAIWPEFQRIAKLGLEGMDYLYQQQAMPDNNWIPLFKEPLEKIVDGV
jgi:hypothetical protein